MHNKTASIEVFFLALNLKLFFFMLLHSIEFCLACIHGMMLFTKSLVKFSFKIHDCIFVFTNAFMPYQQYLFLNILFHCTSVCSFFSVKAWKWHIQKILKIPSFFSVYIFTHCWCLYSFWNIYIWEKVRRTAHVLLAQLHIPWKHHYWDFIFSNVVVVCGC